MVDPYLLIIALLTSHWRLLYFWMIVLRPWVQTVNCSSLGNNSIFVRLSRVINIVGLPCLLNFSQLLWTWISGVPLLWSDIYRTSRLLWSILQSRLMISIDVIGIVCWWKHSRLVLIWQAVNGLLAVICLIRISHQICVDRAAFLETRSNRLIDLVPDGTADARVMSVDWPLGRDHTRYFADAIFEIYGCPVVVTFVW